MLGQTHITKCSSPPPHHHHHYHYSSLRLNTVARAHATPMHTAFVDFSKALDSVNHKALWEVLEKALKRHVASQCLSVCLFRFGDG